jgi:RNA polymerase sigma-70 factor (ECF subfamily)
VVFPMIQMTDKALFRKIKNDDNVAFRQLFHKYYQSLYLFALKFIDEEGAKDLVQDCFFDLWKNRKNTEISSSLSAYLFTIVKNRCYRYLKEEQKKAGREKNYGLILKQEELHYFINSEKSILEFDVKDRIEKVFGQLPQRCGQVFGDSRFAGLSNKEIADKYNISLKAVEKHISKALKLFREEFKDILIIILLLSILL